MLDEYDTPLQEAYMSGYWEELNKRRFSAYWANTSSNSLVGKLIREGDRDIKTAMESPFGQRISEGEGLQTGSGAEEKYL